MSSATNLVTDRLSFQQLGVKGVQERLLAIAETASSGTLVEIEHATGQHAALLAIEHAIRLHVLGPLGDYAFSYNLGADARVDGSVGIGAGEGLRGGSVRSARQRGAGVWRGDAWRNASGIR